MKTFKLSKQDQLPKGLKPIEWIGYFDTYTQVAKIASIEVPMAFRVYVYIKGILRQYYWIAWQTQDGELY